MLQLFISCSSIASPIHLHRATRADQLELTQIHCTNKAAVKVENKDVGANEAFQIQAHSPHNRLHWWQLIREMLDAVTAGLRRR